MTNKTRRVDTNVVDDLVEVFEVLLRKMNRGNEGAVRVAAQQGHTKAQALVREWDDEDGALDLPDSMHDGSPITSVKDMSTVMGISEWSAAVYVQEKGVRHPLYVEAKAIVDSEFSGTAALMLIPRNAGKFAVDGGTSPKDLHCTLFYSGDIKNMPVKTRDEFVDYARSLQLPIIDASVNGQTVFYNEPEKPVCVLNVDSPQLEAARRKVMEGLDVPQTHGYTPHMTVKYLEAGEDMPSIARQPVQAIFDVLRVSYDGVDTDIELVPAQTMDAVDLETKGIIRRVRTAAGARHYGQPIGSIIVRDLIPRLPDKWDKSRDKDGLVWGTSVRDGEMVHETDIYSAHTKKLGNGVMVYVRDKVRGRQHSHYLDATEWTSLSASERKKRATRMAEFSMPKFAEAGDPYFKNEGLRGFDWTYDDDEEMSDDRENMDDRWSWALSDSEDLGIEWNANGREDWFDNLDIRSIESVNNVARQHEEWFPGFIGEVVEKFTTVPSSPTSSTAYASATMPKGLTERLGRFISPVSEISLYRHFWGDYSDEMVETKRGGAVQQGWSSLNVDKIATEHNIDSFTAAAHYTITHEMGHAIINRVGTTEGLDFDPDFMDGLKQILIDNDAWDSKKEAPINSVITKEVSAYGASQVHEMLAESWASYVLSSQPTLLVEDIGRYMEEKLTEHMEGLN